MDLRHVRTFVTVADLGTVSRAAVRLRIAQPALSRHISDLEQELGLKLFDRVGRRLLITGEGEQLLGDCRGLLNYVGGIGERAQDLRRGDVGVLKVAATPLHIEGVFSQFLHHYARRYPNVQVRVVEEVALRFWQCSSVARYILVRCFHTGFHWTMGSSGASNWNRPNSSPRATHR
jgi:DNA-binding transcriptional LysR family regulator